MKDQEWQEKIESWKRSGLSQVEYCRENDLAFSTFQYWRTRLLKKSIGVNNRLVELKPGRETQSIFSLSIDETGKISFKIDLSFSFNGNDRV